MSCQRPPRNRDRVQVQEEVAHDCLRASRGVVGGPCRKNDRHNCDCLTDRASLSNAMRQTFKKNGGLSALTRAILAAILVNDDLAVVSDRHRQVIKRHRRRSGYRIAVQRKIAAVARAFEQSFSAGKKPVKQPRCVQVVNNAYSAGAVANDPDLMFFRPPVADSRR